MNEITFSAGPLDQVFSNTDKFFQSEEIHEAETKKYVFNKAFGIGSWKPFIVDPGFEVSLLKGTIKKPITFKKLAFEPDGFFDLIFCDAPSFEQVSDQNQLQVFGSNANKSAIFSNAKTDTSYRFPVDVEFNWIVMRFFNGYLNHYVSDHSSYLIKAIKSKKPLLIHEHINMDMDFMLQRLTSASSASTFRTQKVRTYALALANFFFERLELRRKQMLTSSVRGQDYEKAFQVKDYLISDLTNAPTIQFLADEFGLSASKLKVLFKQVFGKTIYKYFQEYRMEKARNLLSTKDLNVSEVGYEIGYSNLSHFSDAFKKQFGILPKQYKMDSGNALFTAENML